MNEETKSALRNMEHLTALGERLVALPANNANVTAAIDTPMYKRLLLLPLCIICTILLPFTWIYYIVGVVLVAALCGKGQTRRVKSSVSLTSLITAKHRAVGHILGINEDYLAHYFCSTSTRWYAYILHYHRVLWSWGNNNCGLKTVGYLSSRTQFLDNFIENARPRQVVFLGAGMDTRCHRLAALMGGAGAAGGSTCRCFEVDAPHTQAHKRSVVEKYPAHFPNKDVVYVPVDFEEDCFLQKLMENGFQLGPATGDGGGDGGDGGEDRGSSGSGKTEEDALRVHTLFVLEGVSYYLQRGAVMETLAKVAQCAPRCTVLGMDFATDYWTPLGSSGGGADPSVAVFMRMLARIGEPFQYGVSPLSSPMEEFRCPGDTAASAAAAATAAATAVEGVGADKNKDNVKDALNPILQDGAGGSDTDASRLAGGTVSGGLCNTFNVEVWLGAHALQSRFMRLTHPSSQCMSHYHNQLMNHCVLRVMPPGGEGVVRDCGASRGSSCT